MSQIQGIQITKAANEALNGSFWLQDSSNDTLRCIAAKDDVYAADQEISKAELGEFEYREVAIESAAAKPAIEGGQHLNVNVLNQDALQNLMAAHERVANGTASNEDHDMILENAQLTIRVSGYAVRFNSLTLEQQKDVVTRTFTASL